MDLQSRHALLDQFAQQYREASSSQKRELLGTFALATGYYRRHGMWLLNHCPGYFEHPFAHVADKKSFHSVLHCIEEECTSASRTNWRQLGKLRDGFLVYTKADVTWAKIRVNG